MENSRYCNIGCFQITLIHSNRKCLANFKEGEIGTI